MKYHHQAKYALCATALAIVALSGCSSTEHRHYSSRSVYSSDYPTSYRTGSVTRKRVVRQYDNDWDNDRYVTSRTRTRRVTVDRDPVVSSTRTTYVDGTPTTRRVTRSAVTTDRPLGYTSQSSATTYRSSTYR